MDGAALDRPRPHQRHLHGQVVEVLRQGARQHLHLRPALDLEDAGRLRRAGSPRRPARSSSGIRERSIRSPRVARDLVHAALDRREHPQPEQVDLQEARVRARVLVPLHDLPPLHRRRLHRADVDQRRGRDHHPAGVLGDVARQPRRPRGSELGQRPPARRARPQPAPSASSIRVARVPARLVDVDRPRDPLHLARRQPQRLAEVADRAARPVGGEGRDQRRALRPVALVHPRDQLLADVAREVEVDVRAPRSSSSFRKRPRKSPFFDRVDVREAGQVADERADARAAAPARAAAAARAESGPRTSAATSRASSSMSWWSRKKPESRSCADQRQLLLQPPLGLGALRRPRRSDASSRARQSSASARSAPRSSAPG